MSETKNGIGINSKRLFIKYLFSVIKHSFTRIVLIVYNFDYTILGNYIVQ